MNGSRGDDTRWRVELESWRQFRGHLDLVPAIDECFAYIAQLERELEASRTATTTAEQALADLMNDGLNTAITEMARWDAEANEAEIERLGAALEAAKTALQALYDATANIDVLMPLQDGLRLVATRDRVSSILRAVAVSETQENEK